MSESKQKIGAGHVKAMGRQGAKELAQVLPAFPAHGIQPVEEPGLAGNLTAQEVAKEKGAYESLLGRYDSRSSGESPAQQQSQSVEQER